MKKLISFSSTTLAISILNFISIIILTRLFSPADYGTANLLISYSIIFNTVITLATDQMIMHYYYKISLKSIIKNAKYSGIIITFLITALCLVFLPSNLYIDLFLLIFYSIGLLLNRIYMTIFRMAQSTRNYFIQGFGVKFLELILVIFLAFAFGSHYYFIVIPFILSVLIINLIQSKDINDIIKESASRMPDINFKEQFNFSFPLMVTLLVTALTQNIDKVILNNYVSGEELGIYYSAFKIVGLVTIIYTVVSLVWTPVIIKIADQYNHYLNIIQSSIKSFQYMALWVLLLLLIFKNAITIVLGSEYYEAIPLVLLLIGMPIFMLISTPYSVVITISKQTKYHLMISFVIFGINTGITLILSSYFGVVGAAHAILFSYFLLYILRAIATLKIHTSNIKTFFDCMIGTSILILILMLYHYESTFILIIIIVLFILILSIFYQSHLKRVTNFLMKN